MTDISPKKATVGCFASLGFLLICLAFWFLPGIPGTRRIPTEINLGGLLQAQVSTLNAEWALDLQEGYLTDDSDTTRGRWVYEALFEDAGFPYTRAQLDFHAFGSPFLARQLFPPASMPFDFDEGGNPPDGWSYIPTHADRFIIDCTPETIPENCYVLVVYQEYSLVYRIEVAGAMTLKELQNMLQATDKFMADFLNNTRLQLGYRSTPTLSELGLPPTSD